jgi:hypothetical protein
MRALALIAFVTLTLAAKPAAQVIDRTDALGAAVRPALPFPDADALGELPASGGDKAKWFIIWSGPQGESRITVRANPLHPDTQALSAPAMAAIQEAVVAAERKAQAAYDRAVDELKRTGKATNLDGVTLDDEGVAGERIDAELELTIGIEEASSFEIGSSRPPTVTAGSAGVTWLISIPANTYRDAGAREHFRAAETRLVFGATERPEVRRHGGDDRFAISVAPAAGAFAVVVRGNEQLLNEVVTKAEWTRLVSPNR